MDNSRLGQGRAAAASGDWARAYDLLREADLVENLGAEDVALLAGVAYAAGHLDVTIESWERVHAECVRAADLEGAASAAIRVALHMIFDTALMAPVRAWLKRAERLLEGSETTANHAWLAVARNYERMFSGDFDHARRWARRAIEVGSIHDRGAAAIGQIAEARSLVLDGEVQQGLELLDEAALATVSGELEPLWKGIIYCELVCALQGLAQYDLAEEWTEAMELWRHGQPVGSLHGRCRVHRAEILRLRGAHEAAEEEALRACTELRPYLNREFGWPLTELGQIRLRRGDLDGAEAAFLEAYEAGWDPQPGLAQCYLARGDVALAAAAIRHSLDHPSMIPSKERPPNSELRRAPLLEAQVEIALQAGDLERSQWAADELRKIASAFGSKALLGSAATAAGRVRLAEGDAIGARHEFGVATRLWSEIGAPYETALARTGLAKAHQVEGDADLARFELQEAHAAFVQVGATREADRTAAALRHVDFAVGVGAKKQSLPAARFPFAAPDAEPVISPGQFLLEGEIWSVSYDGRTVRLRDMKGLRYLARLIAEPRREFHVLDLVAAERGWTAELNPAVERGLAFTAGGETGAILDSRAKEAYRRRLGEIEEDIEDARRFGDIEREERADAERTVIVRELSRAIGLGGRDRRPGSAAERARASVTRALRSALVRVRKYDSSLGEHLDQCIRTGTYCVYLPDAPGRRALTSGGAGNIPERHPVL